MTGQQSCILQRAGTIVGLAAIWQSLFTQLLYPVSFTFNRTHDTSAYAFHVVYTLVLLAVIILFAINHRFADRAVLTNGKIIAAVGALGAAGVLLESQLNFATTLNMVGLGAGLGFVALFVPMHFLFWCTRAAENRARNAAMEVALSFALFSLITGARLALDIHALEISVACPLVSSLLAVLIMRTNTRKAACVGTLNLKTLPWGLIAPCLLFLIIGNAGILLFNSSAQLQVMPPFRALMHFGVVAFFLLVALLLRISRPPQQQLHVVLFAVLSLLFVGCTTLAIVLSWHQLNGGSVAFILAVTCLAGFILIEVISQASELNASPTQAAALYLVIVVVLPRFLRSCVMYQSDLIPRFENPVALFIITSLAALLSVAVAFSAIMLFFSRTHRDTPSPEPAAPDNDPVFAAMQQSFQLSDREVEITQAAAMNLSARAIGQKLFIAEGTVYTHLKKIYRKTGVHSKQELIELIANMRARLPQ